jgi:hypothetical protein
MTLRSEIDEASDPHEQIGNAVVKKSQHYAYSDEADNYYCRALERLLLAIPGDLLELTLVAFEKVCDLASKSGLAVFRSFLLIVLNLGFLGSGLNDLLGYLGLGLVLNF